MKLVIGNLRQFTKLFMKGLKKTLWCSKDLMVADIAQEYWNYSMQLFQQTYWPKATVVSLLFGKEDAF